MDRETWKLPAVLISALGLAALPLGLTGCEEEGPAERAGENMDEAADDVDDAIDEAADDIDDAIDDRR